MRHPRILIVEDEAAIRSLIAAVLQEDGYEVRVAGDGLSALQAMDAEQPDLLILDMAMPMMTGDVLLEALRSQGADVPVIVVTANPFRYRRLRERVAAVLIKPFDLTELLSLVTAVLARPR